MRQCYTIYAGALRGNIAITNTHHTLGGHSRCKRSCATTIYTTSFSRFCVTHQSPRRFARLVTVHHRQSKPVVPRYRRQRVQGDRLRRKTHASEVWRQIKGNHLHFHERVPQRVLFWLRNKQQQQQHRSKTIVVSLYGEDSKQQR